MSELCSMQLIPKRLSQSMPVCPIIQKRNFDLGAALAFAGGTLIILYGGVIVCNVGASLLETLNETLNKRHDRKVAYYKQQAAYYYVTKEDLCYKAYATKDLKSSCGDCICTRDTNNAQFLAIINHQWPSRLALLQDLKEKYQKCDLVENEKIRTFWASAENLSANDLKKYRDDFGLIAHRKQCLYHATLLIKSDLPTIQKKAELQLVERLQLTTVSDDVKNKIIKQEKIDTMNEIIKEITHLHCDWIHKKVPNFKLMNNAAE